MFSLIINILRWKQVILQTSSKHKIVFQPCANLFHKCAVPPWFRNVMDSNTLVQYKFIILKVLLFFRFLPWTQLTAIILPPLSQSQAGSSQTWLTVTVTSCHSPFSLTLKWPFIQSGCWILTSRGLMCQPWGEEPK